MEMTGQVSWMTFGAGWDSEYANACEVVEEKTLSMDLLHRHVGSALGALEYVFFVADSGPYRFLSRIVNMCFLCEQ